MMLVAVLAALVGVAASVPPPSSCVVGPWGEWSQCQGSQYCHNSPPASRHMTDAEKTHGKGREAMRKLMTMKNANYVRKTKCIEDGTCPENIPPPSVRDLTTCVDGMAGAYPCSNVDMLAFVNLEGLGYGGNGVSGNDIWVWHDEDRNDDYAIMGTTHGSSFVRITDPVNPVVVGVLDTYTNPSSWRDMKVIGNYAYIVSEAGGHGMQVFDLTQLRDLPSNPGNVFQESAHYNGVSNTHNIVANPESNTVFLVGATQQGNPAIDCHNGGLHMVDVSNPLEPTFSGCFDNDGYVHDAQCLNYNGPDTRYNGNEICYCFNEDSFTIVDITDKQNGVMLSRVVYDGVSYSHQGWATEDNRFLYLDDELDELSSSESFTTTYIWNIEDLENPVNFGNFVSDQESSDHNLYIVGNLIHQSNYMAGYRLLRIDDNGTPTEVGHFDVYPERTAPGFEGTWSNYPWLTSADGRAFTALSSINYGLFLLRPDVAGMQAVNSTPYGSMMRYREVVSGKPGAQCPALTESKTCTLQAC